VTGAESAYCNDLQERDALLRQFLAARTFSDSNARELCQYLSSIRLILGNLSNSVSFAASLLAKQYLAERFDIGEFCAAAKPQGAPGPDIEIRTSNAQTILGEIKTTLPYGVSDFGAAQKREFQKDFDKLNASKADFRFLFVTEERTFNLLKAKYASKIPGVTIC
jgi:hypothetical protein